MHGAALTGHQSTLAPHELAEHPDHRRATHERVGVTAIGAEGVVVPAHGDAEPSSDRLLSEREMARALDQVLHEKIDRKSTRLNSSHSQISYAVFCLKK